MRLLLIDGHYYVFRSFFAIQSLSNSKGEATNAIYGFIKTVRRMIKDVQPDLGAIVWDKGLPKRRTELQPEYKQQRTEMPELMRPQLDFIKNELTELLGFKGVCLEDTEADDLMATYCCEARRRGDEVILATNDKDLFQLVDEHVKVYTTNKTDLVSPKDSHALLGPEKVLAKWGVQPNQIGDVLALIGDTVDNIPGIPGLGPKNASALIGEYGSIEGLLANIEKVKKPALREKLAGAREQIVANREMVRLDLDLHMPQPLEALRIAPKYQELITALEWCEFKGLVEEIRADAAKVATLNQGELF